MANKKALSGLMEKMGTKIEKCFTPDKRLKIAGYGDL